MKPLARSAASGSSWSRNAGLAAAWPPGRGAAAAGARGARRAARRYGATAPVAPAAGGWVATADGRGTQARGPISPTTPPTTLPKPAALGVDGGEVARAAPAAARVAARADRADHARGRQARTRSLVGRRAAAAGVATRSRQSSTPRPGWRCARAASSTGDALAPLAGARRVRADDGRVLSPSRCARGRCRRRRHASPRRRRRQATATLPAPFAEGRGAPIAAACGDAGAFESDPRRDRGRMVAAVLLGAPRLIAAFRSRQLRSRAARGARRLSRRRGGREPA